jgi:hypothetical protein
VGREAEENSLIEARRNYLDMEAYKDLLEADCLQPIPATLYGNVLMITYSFFNKDTTVLGLMVFNILLNWAVYICFLAQATLLWYLWMSLGSINGSSSGLCNTNVEFQLALIGSFFAYMYQPACDVTFELFVIFFAKYSYPNPNRNLSTVTIRSLAIHEHLLVLLFCLFHVVMEIAIFAAVVIVGTKYILTSNGASNLIQSSLSIVFIAEMDDQVAKIALPKASANKKQDWILNHFLTKQVDGRNVPKADRWFNTMAMIRPLVVTVAVVATVLGLRRGYC